MKILVLGGEGMLGHQLLQYLQTRHTVKVTLKNPANSYTHWNLFCSENSYYNIDILNTEALLDVLLDFRPEAVINAVGIVKQRDAAKESIPSIQINALYPHRLSQLCQAVGARMIHMSTDCVFSGKTGNYSEQDQPDAEDLYGLSKYLGEVKDEHCFTIRSSIIGLELIRKSSLIEWFLSQKNQVKGFRKAIYTGLTTLEMSRVIEKILTQHPNLFGVWHIASKPINKYNLLQIFKEKIGKNITIIPEDEFICDRSLNDKRFAAATHYHAPDWNTMLSELADQVNQKNGVLASC
jgi:dTDP-4-dehydrorhamnose reductase